MRSVLFYHLYLLSPWKTVTNELFKNIPQDEIVINLSFDLRYFFRVPLAYIYCKWKYKKVKKIFISANDAKYGEVLGFDKFRRCIGLEKYQTLTYLHSKGVTKINSKPVNDWRELMRHYIMDKFLDAMLAFEKGYNLYGVNLLCEDEDLKNRGKYAFKHSSFIYSGNFVIVNLKNLKEKLVKENIEWDYYSMEGFWGKLTSFDNAFCAHNSGINHYEEEYPGYLYKRLPEKLCPNFL